MIKVDGFNILPVLSFMYGGQYIAGQNVGAGKYDRVKKGMWVSTGMGVGYTIISFNLGAHASAFFKNASLVTRTIFRSELISA